MQHFTMAAGLVVCGGLATAAPAAAGHRECQDFSELRMTLEQNLTDGDAEVVLFAQGEDEGLSDLTIRGPGGRKVVKLEASRRGVGLREFLLESAEPPDLPRVLASFPEGEYSFRARTVSGDCLAGSASLSHELAPATTLLAPTEGEVVPAGPLTLEWAAVAEAVLYVVELENEDTGDKLTFELSPAHTSFTVPGEAIVPDSEYQFGVLVETEVGNRTAVEIFFTTAP